MRRWFVNQPLEGKASRIGKFFLPTIGVTTVMREALLGKLVLFLSRVTPEELAAIYGFATGEPLPDWRKGATGSQPKQFSTRQTSPRCAPASSPRKVEIVDSFRYRSEPDPGGDVTRVVHRSIQRLCTSLRKSAAGQGVANLTVLAFAEYIERHILVPSRRYTRAKLGANVRVARGELAGRLIFECPAGHCWSVVA